jgi:hypothetical protein
MRREPVEKEIPSRANNPLQARREFLLLGKIAHHNPCAPGNGFKEREVLDRSFKFGAASASSQWKKISIDRAIKTL